MNVFTLDRQKKEAGSNFVYCVFSVPFVAPIATQSINKQVGKTHKSQLGYRKVFLVTGSILQLLLLQGKHVSLVQIYLAVRAKKRYDWIKREPETVDIVAAAVVPR